MSFFSFSGEKEEKKHHLILEKIYQKICSLHPNPIPIDNNFSQNVYNEYFEKIDNQKIFFLQKDMKDFSFYKNKIDDFWINGDTTFFNITAKRFFKRIKKSESICSKILKKPFSFEKEEIFFVDSGKHLSYPRNDSEWIKKWEKYLKYLTLLEIMTSIDQNASVLKNRIYKNSFISREKIAREKVKKYIQESLRRKKKLDLFSIYVNVITSQYDPHTNYLSPKEEKTFDLYMSGQTEGIGIELQDHKGYATIVKIISGGPAWKSKKIEVGDKIIKVAKYPHLKYKNIVGMLLEDSINLIRGKRGSQVKLIIQKKNGSLKEISLTRDLIDKKEVFAKSVILLDIKNRNKYGLISLPEFYFNPENKYGRNASEDVKNIILQLKKKNIKGLILDIRNNGGGYLSTVIEIAGFFLGKGPILQIGNKYKKKILENNNNSLLWKGPLVILVNELSASASEILASSISDYKRGIIVGSSQTYGKGTIQTVYSLNSFLFSDENNLGSLKLTTSKFYRVNGNSTQLKGVQPDIIIPRSINNFYLKFMEKNQKNPMKWDSIDSVPSYPYYHDDINNKILENVKNKSIYRLNRGKNLSDVYQDIQLLENDFSNIKKISLNWKKFYCQYKKIKIRNKNFQNLKDYLNRYELKNSPLSYEFLKNEEQKEWKVNLIKDSYISECVNILHDFNGL